MEIKNRLIDDIRVIYIDGNIILEESARLKRYIEPHIEDSKIRGIIFNCEKVKYIDSAGLGTIISIYKTLLQTKKKFVLSSLNSKTMEIFIITKLDKILTITDTVTAAVESMQHEPPSNDSD